MRNLLVFALFALLAVPCVSFAGGPAVPSGLTDAICTRNVPVLCVHNSRHVTITHAFSGLGSNGCNTNGRELLERCKYALGVKDYATWATAQFDLTREGEGSPQHYVQQYHFVHSPTAPVPDVRMTRDWMSAIGVLQ